MDKKEKEVTLFGKYLKTIGARPSKVGPVAGITPKTISLLSTNINRIIYADEFYKTIYVANKLAGLPDENFLIAVDAIFPQRIKADLLTEFSTFSPEGLFFKKYTQQQGVVEEKLGMANGKLSKFFSDREKRALAVEIIGFAEGMKMNILDTFREIFGIITVDIVQQEIDRK